MVNIQSAGFAKKVSEAEWDTRVNLAACYRLVALNRWDDLVFTHLTAKVPGPEEHFLINPFGMHFEEITASSLVKIDLSGNKVSESPYEINPAGFTIHSAIHEARKDAVCVMHLHTDYGVAVSTQENGLLPISQNALFPFATLAYHEYEGMALREDEKQRLVNDIGDKLCVILRNHGTLTIGKCIEDAFLWMYALERACKIQILAQAGGAKLINIPEAICNQAIAEATKTTGGQMGKIAWPALIRKLDREDDSYRN